VNFWWRPDPPAWSVPLQALTPLYAAGAALHRAASRPLKVRVPVISIGNLTVGGAGKTPVTLHLAQRLAARGRKPAVLSRGYGRRSREPLEVGPDHRRVGDSVGERVGRQPRQARGPGDGFEARPT